MKKVLSLLLSVMMVAGLFVALIPTATAAVTDTGVQPAITENMLTTIYEENFDKAAYEGLVGTDLMTALGWTKVEGTVSNTSVVLATADPTNEEDTDNGLSLTGAVVMRLPANELLKKGNFVIEYTQKMTKSGGGTYGNGLGFRQSSYKKAGLCGWNYLVKERGQFDLHPHRNYTTSTTIMSKTETYIASGSQTSTADHILNEVWKFRVVVDATFGIYVYAVEITDPANPVDKGLVLAMKASDLANWSADMVSAGLGDALEIRQIGSTTQVWVDDIKVSTYPNSANYGKEVDGFVVSAVSTNAYPAVDSKRFEYIELYNASTETLNIYDYAISIQQSSATNPTATAATPFQVLPGENTVTGTVTYAGYGLTVGDTVDYNYTNPEADSQDALIAPGETAILVIPSDWWSGSVGTMDDFKELYLAGKLGMTEDEIDELNLFIFADCIGSDYPAMNNSGAALIAVSKVSAGLAKGEIVSTSPKLDSFVIDNKDAAWYGYGYYHGKGTASSAVAGNYTFWDANGNYIPGGQVTSTTLAATKPGFVPVENRRPFTVTYMADGATFTTEFGRLATAYTVTASVPTKAGYTFAGWVDAEGNEVTAIAAADMMGDKVLFATWIKNNEVQWVGYQAAVAEDGKYDLRLIGSVIELTDIKNIAFEITLRNGNVEGKMVYLKYVYKTITADFGESTFEVPNNGYVVVLEIYNCPVEEEFTVQAVTIYEDDSVAKSDPATAVYPY